MARVLALAIANGVPTPAFTSSLAYYDGLRRARGPTNLLQGLRDYFGAHTYRRLDNEGSFHARWSQDGSEVKVWGGAFGRCVAPKQNRPSLGSVYDLRAARRFTDL